LDDHEFELERLGKNYRQGRGNKVLKPNIVEDADRRPSEEITINHSALGKQR
jgi:hypothetical protein